MTPTSVPTERPVGRLLRLRAQALDKPDVGPDLGPDGAERSSTHFFVNTGCAAHDTAKPGSRLDLKTWGGNLEIPSRRRRVLRNSLPILHRHLAQHLETHLDFAPVGNEEEVSVFWGALGVDAERLGGTVALDPCWTGYRLLVPHNFVDDPSLIVKLSVSILRFWRWPKFTESPWCGIGLLVATWSNHWSPAWTSWWPKPWRTRRPRSTSLAGSPSLARSCAHMRASEPQLLTRQMPGGSRCPTIGWLGRVSRGAGLTT